MRRRCGSSSWPRCAASRNAPRLAESPSTRSRRRGMRCAQRSTRRCSAPLGARAATGARSRCCRSFIARPGAGRSFSSCWNARAPIRAHMRVCSSCCTPASAWDSPASTPWIRRARCSATACSTSSSSSCARSAVRRPRHFRRAGRGCGIDAIRCCATCRCGSSPRRPSRCWPAAICTSVSSSDDPPSPR